ncbi:hypothetical protein BIV25_21565 [Streptomyces sp. MUSC 14]|uniref:hypothetical protein n=1 Tax=Streptomyces sp. MUSC 14 TaxID=1354889 RepID=UPI00091C4533|nr:hypothetical protein [Streptomyces sp. MUSC 14]OIJ94672.1 hypothetical protein BIV25_21565 [Streptomyces sp. MUSC 14]
MLAALVSSLAAVSAAVFLLTGCGLRAFRGRLYVSDGLITAGLIAAAVTAGGLIGYFVSVLVAAARNRTGGQGDALDGSDSEVTPVRGERELALLERGAMPFLLACLEEAGDAYQGGNPAL